MYEKKPLLHERQKQFKGGNLRTIALDVTPKCNMRCAHCYAETFARVKPIELDILKVAAQELYRLGVFHYVLQGGEPIVDRERLEGILAMIHPDETYINVVSNGYAMNKSTVRWLKDRKVDKIAFSLDSGIEEEHDRNRLPGSFRKVMQAIDDVLAEGLLTSVSVVVTHTSLYSEGFKRVLEFGTHKGIKIDVQIAEPVGKWDGIKDFLMTPEDSAYIKNLQKNAPLLSNGQKMISRDIYCGDEDHCPAGIEFMGISSDGNVLPCNFLQFSLGNIRDRSFREMRNALLTSKWFSGKSKCLCGEDYEFIDSFIVPYKGTPKPLNANQIFNLTGAEHA